MSNSTVSGSKTKVSTSARTKHSCFNCGKKFRHRWCLTQHLKKECKGRGIPDVGYMFKNNFFKVSTSHALSGSVSEYTLTPQSECDAEKKCIAELKEDLHEILLWLWKEGVMVKWGLSMETTFVKHTSDGERIEKNAMFFTNLFGQNNDTYETIPEMIIQCQSDITSKIDKYSNEGSNWVLLRINYVRVHMYRVSLTPI